MSVLNLNQPTATPSRRIPFGSMSNPNATDGAQRPKAKVWLNIGYGANGKFINLPIGLPIDTMEAADVRGQSMEWVKQRTAQNDLLKALQQYGLNLQPGQEQTINLEVRLRRVNDELAVAAGDNEFAIDFSQLFAPAMQAAE